MSIKDTTLDPVRDRRARGANHQQAAGGVSTDAAQNLVDYPVRVEGLAKAYGSVVAVREVSFKVRKGTTVTLLGPSGCGKTTTLRCIAGLEVPTGGRIVIGNEVVYDHEANRFVEPEKRNIGMVFQSYAIWPHMTVGGNVGFPLAIRGMPRAEVEQRTQRVLELVGLGELTKRPAAALSGGQQQRVALARALVHEPSIVLFDEPLSNLDANLRERMRTELQLLQAKLGFTAIFVTHDQQEALALSDDVIIMNRGDIEQTGSPKQVFLNPRTEFTATFLNYSNVVTGHVRSIPEPGQVEIEGPGGLVLKAKWRSEQSPTKDGACAVTFRADQVTIAPPGKLHGDNAFTGEVRTAAFLGSFIDYTVQGAGGQEIKVEGSIGDVLGKGAPVDLQVAPENCHAFAR
ncbi:ABC transporter ATP-binding protein [Pseudochelatococcus sp. B33]